jgi:two-component system, LytTR family, sensor kinase
MFNLKTRYFFIALLGAYSFVNTIFTEVYNYYNINVPWHAALGAMLLITWLVWDVNRLLKPLTHKIFHPLINWKNLVIFFGMGVAASAIISVVVVYCIGSLLLKMPAANLELPLKLGFTYATRINLFLHAVNAIIVFVNAYKAKELEARELEKANAQAKLAAIKSQVNPHFLFNNLNVLSGLVMTENPDANKFLEAFSTVYRHILNSQSMELVPLQTELDYIEPYIFLLQKRFPESLQVTVTIAPSYLQWKLVPASLQMLVENAIKHNIASRSKPLHLSIEVKKGTPLLTVSNNLQPRQQIENSTKIGLHNIAQRYELIAAKKISVENNGTVFAVAIPLIHPANENADN